MENNFSQEFIENFFGDMTPGVFFANYAMALLGILIGLLMSTTKRDPQSPRTPFHFSWSFLWSDNQLRLYKSAFLNLLILFVSIRFAPDFFSMKVSTFISLGFGLGIDKLVEMFKSKKEGLPKMP